MNRTATENAWLEEQLASIVHTAVHSAERKAALEHIIERLTEQEIIAYWSMQLSQLYRIGDVDEVQQIIAETLCTEILTFTPEKHQLRLNKRGGALQHYWYLCKVVIRGYQESAAHTGVTGGSGAARRRKLAVKGTAELTQILGRDPTMREVIDHVNQKLYAARTNPAKQGVLVSAADFIPPQPASIEEIALPVIEIDFDARLQVDEAIRGLISHLAATHPEVPRIVPCVLAWCLAVYEGVPPTAHIVAADAGCSVHHAAHVISLLEAELPRFRQQF